MRSWLVRAVGNFYIRDNLPFSVKQLFQMTCIICLCFRFRHCVAPRCPNVCECRWTDGKETISCKNTNFTDIPRNLDSALLILDFDGNALITLAADAFNLAGLWNLQRVYLVRCKIKTIDENAFRSLRNLIYLDLSYNILIHVPSQSFSGLPELRELKLNNNPVLKVSGNAFAHARHLKRLDLSECRIGYVDNTAFSGLENTLKKLKLDGNRISNVEPAAFTLLHALHGIELQSNPWNCSCLMRPLRHWLLQRTVPLGPSPSCRYPPHNANKTWAELSKDEFACLPQAYAIQTVVSAFEGDNVTLSCRISGSPIPNVRWILRNRVLLNGNFEYPVSNKKPYIKHSVSSGFSNLTISALELQDSGVYVCVAESVAGKVTSEVILTVDRTPIAAVFPEKFVTIAILMSAVAIIFLCSLVLVIRVMDNKPAQPASANTSLKIDPKPLPDEKIELKSNSTAVNASISKKVKSSEIGHADKITIKPAARSDEVKKIEKQEETIYRDEVKEVTPDVPVPQKPTTLKINRDSPKNTMFDSHIGEMTLQHHVLHKKELPTGNLYTTAMSFMQEDTMNNYPTTVKEPTTAPTTRNKQTRYNAPTTRSQSMGPNYPQTRREVKGYSSQSQSPLLQNNYQNGSSEFASSSPPITSRYSKPQYADAEITGERYPSPRTTTARRSRDGQWSDCSLTSSPERYDHAQRPYEDSVLTKETPLLNIYKKPHRRSRYTNYLSTYSQPSTSSLISPTMASTTYDYHAAQLERFLDEYRQIHTELTKMKESCEKLNVSKSSRERMNESKSSLERSVSFVPNLRDSTIRTASDDNFTPKSILKKTQSEYRRDSLISSYCGRPGDYYYADNMSSSPSNYHTTTGSLPLTRKRYRRFSDSSVDDYTDY